MKFMIDAGHGPNTPGKRSKDGFREYTFNSAVATIVVNLLKGYRNVTTYRSDESTHDVSLHDRVALANTKKVDAFISIHGNAQGDGSEWTEANGIETYVYTSKPKASMELGAIVQGELIRETSRANRGLKTADFYVLKYTNMPAILCECGFFTNKEEKALMAGAAYQNKCAQAIVNGLVKKYKLVKVTNSKSVTYELTGNQEEIEKLIEELSDRGYEVHIKE